MVHESRGLAGRAINRVSRTSARRMRAVAFRALAGAAAGAAGTMRPSGRPSHPGRSVNCDIANPAQAPRTCYWEPVLSDDRPQGHV